MERGLLPGWSLVRLVYGPRYGVGCRLAPRLRVRLRCLFVIVTPLNPLAMRSGTQFTTRYFPVLFSPFPNEYSEYEFRMELIADDPPSTPPYENLEVNSFYSTVDFNVNRKSL